ncbi:MAG TPA: right-handed parallel beta-helix repeat-containing protein [Myxococcota bacterium]|nr:right-handed parallel beta-helix repeat-containing protein [Myxococcota bacterium]
MQRRFARGTVWGLALILSFASVRLAGAVDGVIEINATTAAAGGVTPGDDPGFPVQITQRGSYRLTGDLVVPPEASAGIVISAAGVRLDLNGFTVSSSTTCSGAPPSCIATGAGIGIDASTADSVSVRNGRVTGFSTKGISLFTGGHVDDVTVDNNGGPGVVGDVATVVKDSTVRLNGGAGVTVGADSRVAGNVVSTNAGAGVVAPPSALTDRNAVNHNGAASDPATRSRRFYLTQTPATGGGATAQCAAGFHMASFFELESPSSLTYDREHGYAGAADNDIGFGPPAYVYGWMRLGLEPNNNAPSCTKWTSSSNQITGTTASLWDYPGSTASMWQLTYNNCSQPIRVWCVED